MKRSSTDKRHFIIMGVLIAIGTVALTFFLDAILPLPLAASDEAIVVDRVIYYNLILIAFLFSLVVTPMLYALIVFRRRKGDDSEGEHFEGNTPLEIAWTTLPLLIVILFAFIGVTSLNEVMRVEPDELAIQVEAYKWNYNFTYPGDVITNELVLPVDRPAVMVMTAQDVLHGFWIPAFRVKKDMVPGQITELRFTPTELGEYSEDTAEYAVRCTRLCGLSHWSMVVPVRVVTEVEYTAWLDEQLIAQGKDDSTAQVDVEQLGADTATNLIGE